MTEKIKLITACKCERLVKSNLGARFHIVPCNSENGIIERRFLVSKDFEVIDGKMVRIYREIVE